MMKNMASARNGAREIEEFLYGLHLANMAVRYAQINKGTVAVTLREKL